ncbi:hypothetical protein SNEBB_005076 [Seison nebaliae]|nr:hypothetical protein SNEBB_005076 [Seison nebaliae]
MELQQRNIVRSTSTSSKLNPKRNGAMSRYRCISKTSNCDESLFGKPKRLIDAENMRQKQASQKLPDITRTIETTHRPRQQVSSAAPFALHEDELQRSQTLSPERKYVTHITKNLIRNILIPEDPSEQTAVIDSQALNRLTNLSKMNTAEMNKMKLRESQQYTSELQEELLKRRQQLQELDIERNKQMKEFNFDDNAEILKKADELRENDDEEIRQLNELILNAKIQAIRDAQIAEKQEIELELKNEGRRMDSIMEKNRLQQISMHEQLEELKKRQAREGASEIMKQIGMNEQERLIKEEIKEQENQLMRKHLEKLREEDFKDMEQKKLKQKGIASDLKKVNAEIEKVKEKKAELDRIEDMKVMQYLNERAEKEAAKEQEMLEKKLEKEKEIAKLRAQQERAKDVQAERDALRAKRDQEEREREWRRQEKIDAIKRKEKNEQLRLTREWQIKKKQENVVDEIRRNEFEFKKTLANQIESEIKLKKEEDENRKKNLKYRNDLASQIRQNEESFINSKKSYFEEGSKLNEETRMRKMRIEAIKKKKLDELRKSGIPAKYCNEIERKIM